MAAQKSKTVKKITKIPEASVTIEVEEKEEDLKEEEKTEIAEEPVKEETETEVESDTTEDESLSSFSWKKVFLYTIIAAGLGFLILGGVFFLYKNANLNFLNQAEKKEIVLPSITPKPTAVKVDKEAYEIQVLNGSGIEGEAASVQELLEDEGFKVGAIGNADNSDYTKTQILATEDVENEYTDELQKALEKRGPVEVEKAPSTQTEKVVVIVGNLTTEEEATPTPELE
jgi:hypothetical protein